jgi:hypothetical protein
MVYRPNTENKWCNYSYVNETSLPAGQKLKSCTRCKEVFFMGKDVSAKAWQHHKQTCLSLENDIAKNTTINLKAPMPSFDYCLQSIAWLLSKPFDNIKGRAFLYSLQELRRYLTSPPIFPKELSEEQLKYKIYDSLVHPFRDRLKEYGDSFIQLIWTSPGFCSFMLNEDLMISPIMMLRKLKGVDPIQSGDNDAIKASCGFCLNEVYWALIMEIFDFAIFKSEPRQRLIENALTSAIVRTIMQFWLTKYVRHSLPRTRNIPRQYFTIFNIAWQVCEFKVWMQPHELIPGISAKQMLRTLMDDDLFLNTLTQSELEMFLRSLYGLGADYENDKNYPFSHLSAKDRIELLDISHDWKAPKRKIHTNVPEFFTNVRTATLHMITGTTTRILLEMHDLAIQMTPPPDERTIQMIKKIRNAMIVQYLPKVSIYTQFIEPKYKQKMERLNEETQPFPEVLASVIAEFAFEKKYYWASSKKKGLKFLTKQDIDKFNRDYLDLTMQGGPQQDREAGDNHIRMMQLISQIVQKFTRNIIEPLLENPQEWDQLMIRNGRAGRTHEHMSWFTNRWLVDNGRLSLTYLFPLVTIENYHDYMNDPIATPDPLLLAMRTELLRYMREKEGHSTLWRDMDKLNLDT